jgi:Bacterial regulatory helix-turn-helix protein, lysR family
MGAGAGGGHHPADRLSALAGEVGGGVARQHDRGVATTEQGTAGQQQRPAAPRRRGHHQTSAHGAGQVGGGQSDAPSGTVHQARGGHRTDPRSQDQQRQGQPGSCRTAGEVLGEQRPRGPPGGQAQGAQQLRDDQHPHHASLQRRERRGTGHGMAPPCGSNRTLPALPDRCAPSNTCSRPFTTLECQSGRMEVQPVSDELDPRLLRHFVAVAEELHFTRAAVRLYLAQQALSRDIARLERQLGVRLFIRTTRRVALTPEGEHLLVRARELLALHDQTLQELHGPDGGRPLLVDLLAEGHTPARVLRAARQRAPRAELVARFQGGFGAALELLLAGRLDVAFGRSEGLGRPFPAGQLARRLVRLEPLALLLPESIRSPPSTRCRWRRWPAPR